MLEIKNVNFEYKGNHRALSGVSLNLPSSGIVSIVGPNGSGKSTLLKCINKLLKAEGEILLNIFETKSQEKNFPFTHEINFS